MKEAPPNPELRQDLPELLRRCVECGLCLPHCATYVGTGNEVHSPRGRLALLGGLLEQDASRQKADYLAAFDVCIGCRACESACPSGVPFTLLEKGKELAAAGPSQTPATATFLTGVLDNPHLLSAAGHLGGAARATLRFLLGSRWRRKLEGGPLQGPARLLATMPHSFTNDRDLLRFLAARCEPGKGAATTASADPDSKTNPAPPVVFFTGCANGSLLSGSSRRLLELLRAAGCRVDVPQGQACCGALATHTGRPERASDLRRANLTAMEPHLTDGTRVLVEAAGCGLEMKELYGEECADRVTDAVVLLDEISLPPLGPVPLQVVYHDPCHARHGQGIVAEPRRLLNRIPGLELVEPLESEVCCGSGGAWGLSHPELSNQLGRRKAANLAATGAQLVVTSNPGCLGQIADGLALEAPDLPIIPLTDLLWYAWRAHRPG